MNGSGISWAICKSARCSRQLTMPAPHHSVFYRPEALPATQPTASKHRRNRQSTEGIFSNVSEMIMMTKMNADLIVSSVALELSLHDDHAQSGEEHQQPMTTVTKHHREQERKCDHRKRCYTSHSHGSLLPQIFTTTHEYLFTHSHQTSPRTAIDTWSPTNDYTPATVEAHYHHEYSLWHTNVINAQHTAASNIMHIHLQSPEITKNRTITSPQWMSLWPA